MWIPMIATNIVVKYAREQRAMSMHIYRAKLSPVGTDWEQAFVDVIAYVLLFCCVL